MFLRVILYTLTPSAFARVYNESITISLNVLFYIETILLEDVTSKTPAVYVAPSYMNTFSKILFSIRISESFKIEPMLKIGFLIGVFLTIFPLKIALNGILIVASKVTEAVTLKEKSDVVASRGYLAVSRILFSNMSKFS